LDLADEADGDTFFKLIDRGVQVENFDDLEKSLNENGCNKNVIR
jgi:hypothetical protein